MTILAPNSQVPSPKQLKYACDLGITETDGLSQREVGRLITREVRRRGRLVLRRLNPQVDDAVTHPKYGPCRIGRIGRDTLKVTLVIQATGRKVVIDAMMLGSYCYPVTDEQIVEFMAALPDKLQWCISKKVEVRSNGSSWTITPAGLDTVRQLVAASQPK